jgi:hypothetical protein
MVAGVGIASAQSGAAPSERLLAPYGIGSFSALFRQSVDALFTAWPDYQRGDYAAASGVLDAFWKVHPAGSREWAPAVEEGDRVARTVGVEFGSPPCYYALRMLTECVRWRLKGTPARPVAPPVRFTVILIGRSHGIQPTTLKELHEHGGRLVENTLDPRFREAPGAIIDDCFGLLFEYIRAATGGRLTVETRILQYPNLDVPVDVVDSPAQPTATLAPGAMEQIWAAVGADVGASTDWWDILFPSHRPEQYPEFAHTDFSNGGGIGVGPDGASPALDGDDRVLVTKPPKYGGKPVTPEERIAFFSAVMQHEFFHHFYRTYPELNLEARSHQWFDRAAWPRDFEGYIEPDYYAESLHKRLLQASPPLWEKLRYAIPADVLSKITPSAFRGVYRRDPVDNPMYEGSIAAGASGALRWTNRAGKSWRLDLSGDKRLLLTGTDNPYLRFGLEGGEAFRIVIGRGPSGEYLPQVAGFRFLGDFYAKVPTAP